MKITSRPKPQLLPPGHFQQQQHAGAPDESKPLVRLVNALMKEALVGGKS